MAGIQVCQCLKTDGKKCTRSVSKKVGDNINYCWQHQNCLKPAAIVPAIGKKKPIKKKQPIKKKKPIKKKVKVITISDEYPADYPTLEALLDEDELDDPEDNYKKWIQLYPNRLDEIYVLVKYGMTPEILQDLLDAGWDINKSSSVYPSESHNETPLGSASEYRDVDLVKMLLEKGADPNIIGEATPIELAFSGHSAGYAGENPEDVEAIVRELLKYGAIPVVRQWFYDEFFMQYSETENEFIKEFLKTVKKVDKEDW